MTWVSDSTLVPTYAGARVEHGFENSGLDAVTSAGAFWRSMLPKPLKGGSGLLLSGILVLGPTGTGTLPPHISELAQPRYTGDWTSGWAVVTRDLTEPSAAEPSAYSTTTDQEVRWLHQQSGLTWDQLGRVFGVSRRAVHMWANGGRLNAGNAEVLAQLASVVRALPTRDPALRRAALLAAGPDGRSVLDALRARHAGEQLPINGPGFAPEQLLGARHERHVPEP